MRSRPDSAVANVGGMRDDYDPEEVRAGIQAFLDRRKGRLRAKPWARMAGISPGAIPNFLTGRARSMRYETLSKLASAADVSVEVLVGRAPDPLAPNGHGGGSDAAPAGLRLRPLPLLADDTLASAYPGDVAGLRAGWGGPRAVAPDLGPTSFAYRVASGSLNRVVPPGAVVVVDAGDAALEAAGRYLLRHGARVLMREYRTDGGVPRFVPDSTEAGHEDVFPHAGGELVVLGRVRKAVTDL